MLLAAEGMTDKEIAERLVIARGTVATHWTRMRERTGAANRGQIIARAMRAIYQESEAELGKTFGVYRSLVETLEDFAVFLMDDARKVLTWNPGVGKILGFEADEWIGVSADVIFTPEDRAKDEPGKEMQQALRKGRGLDDRWHVRRDGSRFFAMGVMVPIWNDEGGLVCYSKILRDLTRLKRLEEKVRELGGDPDAV